MPRLFSGDLRVDIKYNDRGHYGAKVCVVRGYDRGTCKKVTVGEPRHLSVAVDSRAAYKASARAAIRFVNLDDRAEYGPGRRKPGRRASVSDIIVRYPRR